MTRDDIITAAQLVNPELQPARALASEPPPRWPDAIYLSQVVCRSDYAAGSHITCWIGDPEWLRREGRKGRRVVIDNELYELLEVAVMVRGAEHHGCFGCTTDSSLAMLAVRKVTT